MKYCTVEDVVDLTGTSLSDDVIDRLIAKADKKIDRTLAREGLSTDFTTVPDNIAEASSYFAAAIVLIRGRANRSTPDEIKVDTITTKTKTSETIALYESEGQAYLDEYIRANGADFRIYRVVGEGGERIGEYETMTGEDEN